MINVYYSVLCSILPLITEVLIEILLVNNTGRLECGALVAAVKFVSCFDDGTISSKAPYG